MTHKAFAAFHRINGKKGDEYRICFNKTAAMLFEGVDRVDIGKTGNYLILFPLSKTSAFGFGLSKLNGNPMLSASRLVKQEGFIPKDLFTGARYAVKRGKTGDNKIYICLKEVVTDDD